MSASKAVNLVLPVNRRKQKKAIPSIAIVQAAAQKKKGRRNGSRAALLRSQGLRAAPARSTYSSGRMNALNRSDSGPSVHKRLTLRNYVEGLEDPFSGPIGKLGFGTFVPTGVHTGWRQISITPSATATCFAIVVTPGVGGDFIRFYQGATAQTALGTSTNFTALQNAATLALQMQTARVISSGIRCIARVAGTGLMGSMGGIYLPDDNLLNIEGQTYDNICNLSGFREFHVSGAGEKGGQVAYRPIDPTSFVFDSLYANSGNVDNTASRPYMVIIGRNFPANAHQFDVAVHEALESLGGLDAAGDDDTSLTDLNIDAIGALLPVVAPPVTVSLTAVDMLDAAMTNVSRSQARYGGFGSISGSSRLGSARLAPTPASAASSLPVSQPGLTGYPPGYILVRQQTSLLP